jgi:hypothetical protein
MQINFFSQTEKARAEARENVINWNKSNIAYRNQNIFEKRFAQVR